MYLRRGEHHETSVTHTFSDYAPDWIATRTWAAQTAATGVHEGGLSVLDRAEIPNTVAHGDARQRRSKPDVRAFVAWLFQPESP